MDRFLNTETDPNLLSPLDLAFLGDCVYELFVREKLVTEANRPNRDLHAAKVRYVNADAQQTAIQKLLPFLTRRKRASSAEGAMPTRTTPQRTNLLPLTTLPPVSKHCSATCT